MAKEVLVESSPLWERFQTEARKRRRNPTRLVTKYLRECLEIWEDETLDEEIRADVQKHSGARSLTDDEAVEVVRQYRREKKAKQEKPPEAPGHAAA